MNCEWALQCCRAVKKTRCSLFFVFALSFLSFVCLCCVFVSVLLYLFFVFALSLPCLYFVFLKRWLITGPACGNLSEWLLPLFVFALSLFRFYFVFSLYLLCLCWLQDLLVAISLSGCCPLTWRSSIWDPPAFCQYTHLDQSRIIISSFLSIYKSLPHPDQSCIIFVYHGPWILLYHLLHGTSIFWVNSRLWNMCLKMPFEGEASLHSQLVNHKSQVTIEFQSGEGVYVADFSFSRLVLIM